MTTVEVLVKARELIATPERWTKGAYAEDANGERVTPRSKTAACWCSLGAMVVASRGNSDVEFAANNALTNVIGRVGIHNWNDAPERTHAEVLAAFDKAIEDERAKAVAS